MATDEMGFHTSQGTAVPAALDDAPVQVGLIVYGMRGHVVQVRVHGRGGLSAQLTHEHPVLVDNLGVGGSSVAR